LLLQLLQLLQLQQQLQQQLPLLQELAVATDPLELALAPGPLALAVCESLGGGVSYIFSFITFITAERECVCVRSFVCVCWRAKSIESEGGGGGGGF
jgi:hypothetical protein